MESNKNLEKLYLYTHMLFRIKLLLEKRKEQLNLREEYTRKQIAEITRRFGGATDSEKEQKKFH